MKYCIVIWFAQCLVLVGVFGDLQHESCDSREDDCEGEEYECNRGRCHCAQGFVPAYPFDGTCVRCPGWGQACWGYCCAAHRSLQCWEGRCQNCYDRRGNWICSDAINSAVISATQIAMGTALVLGILATFVLLYKLCATPDVRTFGTQAYGGGAGRLSVGSLQLYVEERLRDAPPRYSRQVAGSGGGVGGGGGGGGVLPAFPLHGYLNAGFMHDSSVPPPAYSAEQKDDERAVAGAGRAGAASAPAATPTLHI